MVVDVVVLLMLVEVVEVLEVVVVEEVAVVSEVVVTVVVVAVVAADPNASISQMLMSAYRHPNQPLKAKRRAIIKWKQMCKQFHHSV